MYQSKIFYCPAKGRPGLQKTKVVVQDKTERKYPKSMITAYSDLLLEMPIIPHLSNDSKQADIFLLIRINT